MHSKTGLTPDHLKNCGVITAGYTNHSLEQTLSWLCLKLCWLIGIVLLSRRHSEVEVIEQHFREQILKLQII